jgi:hypothetical protein
VTGRVERGERNERGDVGERAGPVPEARYQTGASRMQQLEHGILEVERRILERLDEDR